MQHEKAFDTGELTLSYSEGGTGAPMVLLHGLTSNKSAWLPLLPALEAEHRVYAFDMRGHGKSGRAPDNQYRIHDYARDIIAFLKHLGTPVVLMGQSLGGLVALVTAAQYGEGVRALVLLDPPLFGFRAAVQAEPQRLAWMSMVASVMQGSPSQETIVERLRAAMPDATDEQLQGTAHYISGVAPGAAEAPLHDQIWQGSDLHQSLQQLRCPTLLIHGDWNSGAVVQPEDIEPFKTSCPLAQIVRLPGADHALNMQQQPELVLQPVTQFLRTT